MRRRNGRGGPWSVDVTDFTKEILTLALKKNLKIATAESCTGGLIAAALTDLAGSSGAFDRGFVTYSNAAKIEMLGGSQGLPARVVHNSNLRGGSALALSPSKLAGASRRLSLARSAVSKCALLPWPMV